ncbi:oxidoreductase, short chain dehydrogenase/reductase family protein [Bifidobacterium margollesii]|uniref:Oxidoreductase, short chain dehydrogenase/reductase family protein n=1 Tax=Bifidobacterium margollesii TaxID=2020964 RepID=A0A2N5J9V2_9BIFI|nr:SDR family NAD(P)-dependent oxidoreductase [Bifidobacterium margollesii]PLS30996.1 oxidoreductase, short chain dehydrogenase/reductase family protein [Bifidobacterium margollesii]
MGDPNRRTILITGASGGIGKQTALALAEQGHVVIMHGRNPGKTRQAREWVVERSGNHDVHAHVADLSLMSEVSRFAAEMRSRYDRLDVLVNNAGGQFGGDREVTEEGHERTFAINTLQPFLLTSLLLPLLERSPSARIVTVSSESYRQAGLPMLDDIELEHHYTMVRAYAFSKLYVWWLMRRFDARLKASGITNVTVNTVEPGAALTALQRDSLTKTPFMLPLLILWLPFMRTARHGARTSVLMAASPTVEGVSGEFWGNRRPKRIDTKWVSEEGERRIWDYCEQACESYLHDGSVTAD